MPFRKLAGYKKNGDVWVNPQLSRNVQVKIKRHEKTFQKALLSGKSRTDAIRLARKAEHRGMTKSQVLRYEGKVGAFTKNLKVRKSFSPLRKGVKHKT